MTTPRMACRLAAVTVACAVLSTVTDTTATSTVKRPPAEPVCPATITTAGVPPTATGEADLVPLSRDTRANRALLCSYQPEPSHGLRSLTSVYEAKPAAVPGIEIELYWLPLARRHPGPCVYHHRDFAIVLGYPDRPPVTIDLRCGLAVRGVAARAIFVPERITIRWGQSVAS